MPSVDQHPHGVRITARLYGSVVFQTVRWRGAARSRRFEGVEAVPTPSHGALVRLAWESASVRVKPSNAEDAVLDLQSPEELDRWQRRHR